MDLTDWVPVHIRWRANGPAVEWRWFDDVRFTDPFFDETVEEALARPFSLVFPIETGIETLREAAAGAVPQAGFVYHLSRCGSTLVTQMLAASPRNLVLSEPPPVDQVLQAKLHGVPDDVRAEWLRAMLGALGRPRGAEERLFVKLDTWHVVDLPFVVSVFPDVPWIFVFRDPVEILVSHLSRVTGPQMIPGVIPPEVLGLGYESLQEIDLTEYAARVLGRVASEAADQASTGRGLLVDYRELPEAMTGAVAAHFGLELTDVELDAMRAAGARNAKNPVLPFEPDSEERRASATPEVEAAADRWARPAYDRLVELRGSASIR
jgi:Sulfotransferase family